MEGEDYVGELGLGGEGGWHAMELEKGSMHAWGGGRDLVGGLGLGGGGGEGG